MKGSTVIHTWNASVLPSQPLDTVVFHTTIMISPPVSSVTASIDVVSRRLGTFRVRCTSSGGRALNMSITGPGFSEDLDNIQAVGTPQRMGSDSFSGSIVIISGGSDGQVYECTASNGVSSDPTGSVELRGDLCIIITYNNYICICIPVQQLLFCVAILYTQTNFLCSC